MKVSRSGYYEWLKRPECNRDSEDKNLIGMIKQIFNRARGVYGTRRIVATLLQMGINTALLRKLWVWKLM